MKGNVGHQASHSLRKMEYDFNWEVQVMVRKTERRGKVETWIRGYVKGWEVKKLEG